MTGTGSLATGTVEDNDGGVSSNRVPGGRGGEQGARWVPRPWVGAAALVLIGALVLATVGGRVVNRDVNVAAAFPEQSPLSWLTDACSALLFGIAGWYVARRRPAVAFGWLSLAAGLGHAASGAGFEWLLASELGGDHLPGVGLALWLVAWGSLVELPVLAVIYCLFPDGRLPRGWQRTAAMIAIALATAGLVISVLNPRPVATADPAVDGLVNGFSFSWVGDLADVVPALFGPALLLATALLLLRWRAAVDDRRQVLGWMAAVAIPTSVVVPLAVVALPDAVGVTIAQASTVLVLAALVTATLRAHVYGIEVVLSRTLVWTALTALVVAIHAGVGGVGTLLGTEDSALPGFAGAVVAVVLLIPASIRVRTGIDHLLFGDRGDPYRVVSQIAAQLGATASADELLPSFVRTAAVALRVPYVAVEFFTPSGDRAVHHGRRPDRVDTVALVHQGQHLGQLQVGRRTGEGNVPESERLLREDLARQAAAAVATIALTEGLRRSRERIVTAREEERRRLRRDLHDGLGPQLTGVALGLDVVAVEVAAVAPSGAEAIDRLRGEIVEAITDVRRLVNDLRPPRLDEVGLAGALRELASRIGRGELVCHVDIPDQLAPLAAATEVAVYRIASEALTNVVRHANARSCWLRLTLGADLRLEVLDDGHGVANASPVGLGTQSMQERAEELGGTLQITALSPRGCSVVAVLPLEG